MIIYNPYDVFIVQRNFNSSSFQEVVLSSQPNSLMGFDGNSNPISISSGYAGINSVLVSAITTSFEIFSINNTSSFQSAFYNYYAAEGSSSRAGQIIANWNTLNVNYFDNSMTSFGNTNDLTMSVILNNSGSVQLVASTVTSTGWNVKASVSYL